MWTEIGHVNKRVGSVLTKAEINSVEIRKPPDISRTSAPTIRIKGAAPARGEGGGRGVQLRGVELNRVVGSGGVETDKFTVDPSSRVRHL